MIRAAVSMPQASHHDMSAAFLASQVYVLWPDNGIWYKAELVKVFFLVLSGYSPVIYCTCLASARSVRDQGSCSLQLRIKDMKAVLEYPKEEESEEVDLTDLMNDGHIALSKLRTSRRDTHII